MEIPNHDAPLIIRALRHYADYMRATDRDERPFLQIADKLMQKQPQSETEKKAGDHRKT